MNIRFITKRIHAFLDYPVAFVLIAAPFLLGLGSSHPMAFSLSLGAGIAALILTILTNHHLGVFRVLPYRLHLAADLGVGLIFLAAPFIFGFTGVDALFYWANGAAVVAVVSLHSPERLPLQRSQVAAA